VSDFKSEFKLGWGPLFAATIGTMCGLLTLTNYTQGFFVGPVMQEFGWTPAQFFLSYTVFMCAGLITAPIVGSLAQKHGIRDLGMIGLVGHALGYVIISMNTGSLPLWYASWAIMAVLAAGSLPIIWTSVLNGWFVKNRGKAIGITMAGTGIGAFLLPPIVEYLITNYGWRTAYRGIGLGALAISLPIVWTLFKENEANKATGAAAKRIWGYTRAEAMKMPKFWILGAVLGLTVLVMAGLLSNFKQLYTSLGMDGGNIAKLAALMGITIIFGRLLVGYLMDRFWAPAVAVGFYTMPIIGMIILLNTPLTMGTGAMVAICIGLAAGAVLDLLAYLTSKYFGPDYYAKIFGATFTFFTVGAGFAPPLFGKLAQNNGGDYAVALKFGIGVLLVSCILFLLLGKYPQEAISEQGH